MKNLVLFAFLIASAQAAFAQVCEVDMVDRYSRVVSTFRAYGDPNTCIEGMKECRKTIRLSPHLGGVDCIRRGTYNPQPQPQPYPRPQPNPYPPVRDLNYYLTLSDGQLAQEALYGIGRCKISVGNYNTACDYYLKVNGYGFGGGSGCTQAQYARQYGCNYYTDFENAGCLTRVALRNRQCL